MEIWKSLLDGLAAGCFAAGLAVLFTAPPKFLLPAFLCGGTGRLVRDEFVACGLGISWSTLVAAALVVVLATLIMKRHTASPVVLISAVLPLGAATAIFNMLFGLMQLHSLSGEELNKAAIALLANVSRAFTVTLALALGISLGLLVVRFLRRDDIVEV